MSSSSRDQRQSGTQPGMSWRRRSENSTSSGYSSAATCSGGLYRNLPKDAPTRSPPKAWDAGPPRAKRIGNSEDEPADLFSTHRNKLFERVREFLPCFVKPRRSVLQTDEELEVRLDEISRREVWVRPIGFLSEALKEALKEAELTPLEKLSRAHPILVIAAEEHRKRGLIRTHDENSVEYLDVDSGRVEEVGVDQVFAPTSALLAIPNAAIRCRLNVKDEALDSKLLESGVNCSDWTRTKVHVMKWACIPTVSLSVVEPNFDLKPVIETKRVVPRQRIQKLYRTLPGIVIPPPFTILRNCSVLHVDQDYAYIVQNGVPFEIDPSESTRKHRITPSLREREQLYIEGDIVCAQYNELRMRVMIGEKECHGGRGKNGSRIPVISVDTGSIFSVADSRELEPLLDRDPPRALKVALPPEYYKIRFRELAMRPETGVSDVFLENNDDPSDDEIRFQMLSVLLETGVFDVFFENNEDPPTVRLFTPQGLEMHVCVAEKIDLTLDSPEIDSEDDRSSTRSCRG